MKISIHTGSVDGDGYLLMMVENGAACGTHRITLAQARALSLDIIKQVYRAESMHELTATECEIASVRAFSFQP